MTPTATKTKPSAAKRKRELQQALEAATAERDETANRAAQHRRRINELKDFLAQRHTGHPQDFTESGVPEPLSSSPRISTAATARRPAPTTSTGGTQPAKSSDPAEDHNRLLRQLLGGPVSLEEPTAEGDE
jgi:hypothetical protein